MHPSNSSDCSNVGPDISEMRNEEIVQACHRSKTFGPRVVRLSETVVVKHGLGVTAREAVMQMYIWNHADCKVFRVPKVLRFFTDENSPSEGFLVMEYIEGPTLEALLADTSSREALEADAIRRIVEVITHLSQIPLREGWVPGPMGNEIAQGYLFGDEGAGTPFKSIKDLENWINQRLHAYPRFKPAICNPNAKVTLNSRQFSLCHNDLSLRNIIWRNDDSFWILDWGFAGIYPSTFEIYALQTRSSFEPIFLRILPSLLWLLSREEKQDLDLLRRVQYVQTMCGGSFSQDPEGEAQVPAPRIKRPPPSAPLWICRGREVKEERSSDDGRCSKDKIDRDDKTR